MPVAASDADCYGGDVPRRVVPLLPSVFLSSLAGSLLSRVPLPSLHAALLLSTQRPTHDRTKRGRTDRVTHTVDAISLSLVLFSLVAKRSFVPLVPLFAVRLVVRGVRTSLTMISCKGLLRSPSSRSGRIGLSCWICGVYDEGDYHIIYPLSGRTSLPSLSILFTSHRGGDHGTRNR